MLIVLAAVSIAIEVKGSVGLIVLTDHSTLAPNCNIESMALNCSTGDVPLR
jgi:hypothetical protein